ncbi:hypothetical protein [Caulobacter sp. 17J80-11]|uniref:hypothetical protein n=1 Tax=Caulobacter sp. 17J80-11 TaxID=2763502 RepID=UPI001653D093|nr:hypothetical protein [Caulobacter sp. 17J80-11]MBC6982869.1 hypothetical protein [Caulobacter sp. 17J80-11]
MSGKRIGVTFADQFGIPEDWLKQKGVFNPTLDFDAPLYIDPFLLPDSRQKEFSSCAFEAYEAHFAEIHRLLMLSVQPGDKAWAAALKRFRFRESAGMGGTCLGYTKHGTKGRGWGPVLSGRALHWAKGVIDLGVKDPEMFSSMSLFEDGVGPDLISDMVTNIALECILKFNDRIYRELEAELGISIGRDAYQLNSFSAELPKNPFSNTGDPVILVADDVLKFLPLMEDPRQLPKLIQHNEQLRDRVNNHIGEIFKIRTKRERDAIRRRAMVDANAFQTLLDLLKILEKAPYDIYKDPQGLVQWSSIAKDYASVFDLKIDDDQALPRIERIDRVCGAIIQQFTELVEDRRLWRVFYVDGKPRHERFAQLLFLAIAVSYCDANGLDISPESDAGAGPVDFKFSVGSERVLVEIKLSTNSSVVSGYTKQLDAYNKAERAKRGHYVLIDVGEIGEKWDRLREIAAANPDFAKYRKLHLVDGTVRESASKLK